MQIHIYVSWAVLIDAAFGSLRWYSSKASGIPCSDFLGFWDAFLNVLISTSFLLPAWWRRFVAFLSFSLWGFLWFGPLFFHETRFHETHDKTWKMSKVCEDCSKEAYLIATFYMYESLHFFSIWQVQCYTFTTRATMEKQTKGESWWQNVTLDMWSGCE